MAIGEGFVQDGGEGGARVLKTINGGKNWTEIYVYGANEAGSGLAINMLSETEAWAGTCKEGGVFHTGAEFSHTVDGGKTWTTEPLITQVGSVTAMSWVSDT